jgi:hypothetical protein
MAVYGRGDQAKKRDHREDNLKGKSMHNRCHHMQRQLVSGAVSHGRCTQQCNRAYMGKGIIGPPLLPGDERIDGKGVSRRAYRTSAAPGRSPPPRRPEPAKRRWREKEKRREQERQRERAITRKWASRPRFFRMGLGFSQFFWARNRGLTEQSHRVP